jgi:hypothetical protein
MVMMVPPAPWQWPLWPARVIRPFDPPEHPWSAGHRGVDLATSFRAPVYAAGPGRVGFARDLAGRGVVTVIHGTLRTTYMPVRPSVREGQTVRAGARIGVVEDVLGHCGRLPCLHWGLRRGTEYLDPLSLLGRGPVRLLPWWPRPTPPTVDGAGRCPAPPENNECPEARRPDDTPPGLRPIAATTWSGNGILLVLVVLSMAALSWAARRSGARMRLPVRLPEPLGRHMRVQLRGRQRRVPENLLHAPEIGPAFEEVRRRTVP